MVADDIVDRRRRIEPSHRGSVESGLVSGPSLADPDLFVDGVPHELLAELRATTPVAWQEMDGEPGFWAVLRHADVVTVAREPNLFSASEGGVVLEDLTPESLEMMRMMLLAMDPPEARRLSPTVGRQLQGAGDREDGAADPRDLPAT